MSRPESKDVGHYMSLGYTVVMRLDEEGDVVAEIQELPGCISHGRDAGEAWKNVRDVQKAWIEEHIESGELIPEPEPDEVLPSGKWVQRVPRTLHKRLTELAKKEDVSLNQLVTSMLSEGVVARAWKEMVEDWITTSGKYWGHWGPSCSSGHLADLYIVQHSHSGSTVFGAQMLSNIQKLLPPAKQHTQFRLPDAYKKEIAEYSEK